MLKYSVTLNSIFAIFTIVSRANGNTVNFEGIIAGNRTISECVNGYKSSLEIRDPDMYITTTQFAIKAGYVAEEHIVETDDGYILTLHRISGKPGAPPVFLQHGLLCSSFDWLVIGKENALAFRLAEAGFDVWLGNFRGNTYSRCHTKYQSTSFEFWDFSWHEMGIYDLPAMITYVTKVTSQQIIYVGHSMGTTAFFVMASERIDIASKIKVMFALSPIAYIDHATSPLRLISRYIEFIMKYYTKFTGTGEFLSSSSALKKIAKYMCNLTTTQREICTRLVLFLFNSYKFDYTFQPEFFYHYPAGTSMKIINHYSQQYNFGKFQYYDYGTEKNSKLYNSHQPPEYNISKITVPIGLFWSNSDLFSNEVDVMRLYNELPNTILNYQVKYSNFNHADYMYAIDAPKHVYEKLVSVVENYK